MPPAERVRIGIVGAGFMGTLHAELAARDPRARVVAVADMLPAAAATLAARFDATPYGDAGVMLAAGGLDLCVVATPPSSHVDVTCAALAGGHVALVEKPACLSRTEMARAMRAARIGGGRLLLAENLLFAPAWRAAARAASDLGPIHTVRVVFHTPGPHAAWLHTAREGHVLFDLGSHAVAACLHALPGRRVVALEATGTLGRYGGGSIVDSAMLTLLFDDGATARCDMSWRGGPGEDCALALVTTDGDVVARIEGDDWIEAGGYRAQMRAAIDSVLGLAPYPVPDDLAAQVTAILEDADTLLAAKRLDVLAIAS